MFPYYRSFTDLRRGHPLFSLATPSVDNDFLIYKDDAHDQMNLHIRNQYVYFAGQNYKLNTWHSLCSTWDSASGLAQLWLDGKPANWKLSSQSSINGPIIIVLGQVQFSSTVHTRNGSALWEICCWAFLQLVERINAIHMSFTLNISMFFPNALWCKSLSYIMLNLIKLVQTS